MLTILGTLAALLLVLPVVLEDPDGDGSSDEGAPGAARRRAERLFRRFLLFGFGAPALVALVLSADQWLLASPQELHLVGGASSWVGRGRARVRFVRPLRVAESFRFEDAALLSVETGAGTREVTAVLGRPTREVGGLSFRLRELGARPGLGTPVAHLEVSWDEGAGVPAARGD